MQDRAHLLVFGPMSYDLYLLRQRPGESTDDVLEQQELDEDIDSGPLDPACEERKRKLAAAIEAAAPVFKPFVMDYAEVAKAMNCMEEQARRRMRHIELNEEPPPGHGIQVTVNDDSVAVTVPYWHTGEKARRAFEIIAQVCEPAVKAWGLAIHDPQLDRMVTLPADLPAMRAVYEKMVADIHDPNGRFLAAATAQIDREFGQIPVTKKWWQFWR